MLPDTPRALLVTGAGGPAGVAVIRALVERGFHVAAADCDPMAAGLRLAHSSAVLPRYDHPLYIDQLCRLAEKAGCRALVSTLAEEVAVLEAGAAALDAAGLARWLPPATAVARCIDKWQFWQLAVANGIPVPDTSLGASGNVPGPWIVKPRFGRGSRDVHLAMDVDQLRVALARVPDPIVQTCVTGREFTVDALIERGGALVGAVPRWRLETKAGISVKGETFASPPLTALVARLVAAAELEGPVNVQGFVADDGAITFIEINPRFSGALPLSLAAGADIVGEYVRRIAGHPLRPERLRHRVGVRMIRYFEEVFEE